MIKVEFEGKKAQISEDLRVTGDGVLVAELETEVTLAEATETEVTPFLALYYNLKNGVRGYTVTIDPEILHEYEQGGDLIY